MPASGLPGPVGNRSARQSFLSAATTSIRQLAAAGLLVLGLAGPVAAQCRLALVLGLDISSSVDADEDALQRLGLARALRAPEVVRAVFAGAPEWVALSVFEWSGREQQDLILDWTDLRAPADLERAAERIAASTRSYAEFPTAIGSALTFASRALRARTDCLFRTVDLSGDGIHNDGTGPLLVYRNDPTYGSVTVNALVITGEDLELLPHYRTTVLHGPGAFLEIADGFADFERAIRRKLLREIGSRVLGLSDVQPRRPLRAGQ